ncbi:MAG: polysaccharide deacetylase family protein [Pseudomonadales bacterium]|nr:MAG: polysaccharide deacetylase family protein [Pseudomonadales bacterium]
MAARLRNPVTQTNPWGLTQTLYIQNDDHTDWTVQETSGTLSTASTDGVYGEAVVQFDVAATDNGKLQAAVTDDATNHYTNGMFTRLIKINDFTKLVDTDWYLFPNTGSYRSSGVFVAATAELADDNEWFLWQQLGNTMAEAGAPGDFDDNTTPLDLMSLWSESTGSGLIVQYGAIYGNVRHDKARIIISADDSNDTDYTVFYEELKARGLKGQIYAIPSLQGDSARTTWAQLQEMQDSSYISVGTHGSTNLTTLTYTQATDDLITNRDLMIANGDFDWQHYSYPEGDYNLESQDALEVVGYRTARTTKVNGAGDAPFPYVLSQGLNLYTGTGFNLTLTRTGDTTYDLTAFQTAYDEIIAKGLVAELYVHRIQATVTAGSGHTHTACFTDVLDILAASVAAGDIEVVHKADLYEAATGLGSTAATSGFDILDNLNNDAGFAAIFGD